MVLFIKEVPHTVFYDLLFFTQYCPSNIHLYCVLLQLIPFYGYKLLTGLFCSLFIHSPERWVFGFAHFFWLLHMVCWGRSCSCALVMCIEDFSGAYSCEWNYVLKNAAFLISGITVTKLNFMKLPNCFQSDCVEFFFPSVPRVPVDPWLLRHWML